MLPTRISTTLLSLLAVSVTGCGDSGSSGNDTEPSGTGAMAALAGATGGASTTTGGSGPATGGFPSVAGGGAPGFGGTPSGGGSGAPTDGGAGGGSSGGATGAGGGEASGGEPGAGGAPPATTCLPSASLVPGETNHTIQVGGTARTYLLHVPASYTGAEPVPLVVDWHPLFGTGAVERGSSGYLALSDRDGFIVAWPDGIDNAWNIGPCCTRSRSVDDLGFARALVAEIESLGCVDTKRVYAAGFSMGGGMSHYLACNAADIFAAVAPSAFDLLSEDEEPCAPSRPITVISFRGTLDPIVPYAGGPSNPPNGLPVTIHFRGAQATFEHWTALNGCTGATTTDGQCETVSACDGGVETTLCTAPGGGHATGDAQIGWAMMQRHPMP